MKYFLVILLFVISIFSCSNKESKKYRSEKHFKIHIENGPRQGFGYSDFMGNNYTYIYTTITITNDSTVPIHLEISFPKKDNDSLKSKVFLLPRALTPKKQHSDTTGMPNEVKLFLDKDVDTPISLDKIINSNESCVVTFGTLTAAKYNSPVSIELITSVENQSILSLKLTTLNSNYIIPCGQISLPKN